MKSVLCLAVALLLALTCACACSRGSDRAGAEAVVTGTVLDGATGAPVSEVRLAGPHDTHAVSGSDGRFEMSGLRAGDEGDISAHTDDGRSGSVTLRPLAAGRLEVVVKLYRR